MFKRISILLAVFAFSMSAHATLIDFTDQSWKDAITGTDTFSATVGNVTVASTGRDYRYLTFNANDNGGCLNGPASSILECKGDGIGIRNDEITQGGYQEITVSFQEAVNITNIYLLDLFFSDNGNTGNNEIALIDSNNNQSYIFTATEWVTGGFYATGFTGQNISSIIFSANNDGFSDYAIAGIDISPVPIPGAAILFGSALLGFFGFKRRRA